MDMQPPPVVASGTAPQEHVRAAHDALDRFAAAYPDAVPRLAAWITAQLPEQVDDIGRFPLSAGSEALSHGRSVRSTTTAERCDVLAPVIRAAKDAALDPLSPQGVWAVMVRMAEDRQPPLLGYSSDGIQYAGRQYQAEGIPDVLTFKNLSDRMRRKRSQDSVKP